MGRDRFSFHSCLLFVVSLRTFTHFLDDGVLPSASSFVFIFLGLLCVPEGCAMVKVTRSVILQGYKDLRMSLP